MGLVTLVHRSPGDLRPCCKQRAVWRAVNDALSPSSIAFFGHAGQLCICFACVCQNLRPTSGDRANPTQPISSPSAAAPGFHRLLFYLAGLLALIVAVFAFRRLTRSFQNALPTDLNTSCMPAPVPHACNLSPAVPQHVPIWVLLARSTSQLNRKNLRHAQED